MRERDGDTDEMDSTLDEIAERLGTVEVSDGFLEEKEVEKGEQFGYDDSR